LKGEKPDENQSQFRRNENAMDISQVKLNTVEHFTTEYQFNILYSP